MAGRSALGLVLRGSLAAADVPGLCALLRAQIQNGDAHVMACNVEALHPDAVAIDALARLQLTARRLHRRIELLGASDELRTLLEVAGLTDVLPECASSGIEPSGQTEQGKEARGVEEEDDPGDLPV